MSRREKSWEQFKDNNPPKGQAALYYKDNREYWLAGYDAAMKDAEVLVKACEGYVALIKHTEACNHDAIAIALAAWRESEGG